jgi:GTP-binding protein Era
MPRAGFIGLVGRPNVGKSTLLNQLLGQKIAIATPRPQTTRNRILGVKNAPDAQLVLVDTPGMHRPSGKGRTRLNKFMMGEALQAFEEVDALVVIVEAPEPGGAEAKALAQGNYRLEAGSEMILQELKRVEKPAILAVNKVDALRDKGLLLPLMDTWGKAFAWKAMVPISALTGDGVERLEKEMIELLPEGEPLYPDPDMITDRATRWIGAEFIREQVFLLTKQEVPYSVAVSVDEWLERKPQGKRGEDIMVSATIHVEKEAQKKIVVGEGGRMIREIGSRARHEIGKLTGCPVHLKLFVRVDEGWTGDPSTLRDLGYESGYEGEMD